jgi:hypothetical protein
LTDKNSQEEDNASAASLDGASIDTVTKRYTMTSMLKCCGRYSCMHIVSLCTTLCLTEPMLMITTGLAELLLWLMKVAR